jgi:rhodanese-related sulfurtransferase
MRRARCPISSRFVNADVSGIIELDVETFGDWRKRNEPHLLLDVREAIELETAAVDGATWIPMGQIVERVGEIPDDVPVVVMCHHGGRSAKVAEYLNGIGRSRVHNLSGGIDAYAKRIDPSIERY